MNILKTEKPQTIANILTGKQTILVMKQAPKNGEGRWWYLYCSKGKHRTIIQSNGVIAIDDKHYAYGDEEINGKVVARFWCDKVEEIKQTDYGYYFTDTCVAPSELQRLSCLTNQQIYEYAFLGRMSHKAYAIHISKLEIFDRPRELDEFVKPITYYENISSRPNLYDLYVGKKAALRIKKAPANYCYVEEE